MDHFISVNGHIDLYKYNATINDINDDLLGTARAIGIKDNQGWDFTLTASKTVVR